MRNLDLIQENEPMWQFIFKHGFDMNPEWYDSRAKQQLKIIKKAVANCN